MATSPAATTYVIDEQTFATEVLERSKSVPVVVDFWADWCGPCRVLGPVLEKLATEFQGAFILAKLDVDRNPNLSMQYGVQGIPAVKAFANGQVANEFTGALPESQVRQFIQQVVPSTADLYAQQGHQWEISGQPAMAIENYKAALEEQTNHYSAMLGLGHVWLKQGQVDEALSILAGIPAGVAERTEADALITTAQFQRETVGQNEPDLWAKIHTNPDDVASRYTLASLLVTQEKYKEALEEFLEVVRRNRQYNDDGARKAMLALFTTIGDDDPVTKEYRRKLANVLF
ncbi:thioredoxin [Chloroflexota bacterium]